jgi:hypothetical protein
MLSSSHVAESFGLPNEEVLAGIFAVAKMDAGAMRYKGTRRNHE